MKNGMAADPGQPGRSKPAVTVGIVATLLEWMIEVREATKKLLLPRHRESTKNRPESVAADARAAQAETDSIDATTTARSFSTASNVDANAGSIAVNGICQTVFDQQEIARRRDLVRALFNDFWTGIANKPTSFAKRLDQAEDYLNARLGAYGEAWRLDANTRAKLGLPPRSVSLD